MIYFKIVKPFYSVLYTFQLLFYNIYFYLQYIYKLYKATNVTIWIKFLTQNINTKILILKYIIISFYIKFKKYNIIKNINDQNEPTRCLFFIK